MAIDDATFRGIARSGIRRHLRPPPTLGAMMVAVAYPLPQQRMVSSEEALAAVDIYVRAHPESLGKFYPNPAADGKLVKYINTEYYVDDHRRPIERPKVHLENPYKP